MKTFLSFPALAIVCCAVPLHAEPDYDGLNQSVTNYFAALDGIVKKLPTVETAAGTADLVNEWALANEIFANAGEEFIAKNPEMMKLAERPPEFVAAFGRLNHLKTDYAALPAGVGTLVKRFQADPEVLKAFARFRLSLFRVQQAGLPPKGK